ncbi:UNVERIFIED_CONTAM: hypothetical protein H355_016014, partial [Colinus virginianus]
LVSIDIFNSCFSYPFRGSLKTFVHTVHLLQKQTDLGTLPVADVLYRLLLLEGGPGSPSCLLGGKHIVSWGFEDMLPAPDASSSSGENKGELVHVCQY